MVNVRRRGRAGALSWKQRTQAAVDLALASPDDKDRGGTEEVWGWVVHGGGGEIRRWRAERRPMEAVPAMACGRS